MPKAQSHYTQLRHSTARFPQYVHHAACAPRTCYFAEQTDIGKTQFCPCAVSCPQPAPKETTPTGTYITTRCCD